MIIPCGCACCAERMNGGMMPLRQRDEVNMKIDGGCHCGQIRYEAEVNPEQVSICHCTDCQILTGTPYRVSVPSLAGTFKILTGSPKIYVKTAQSGNKRAQAFCADCGSPLYASDAVEPKMFMLRVGTMNQRALLPAKKQIWCRSALTWAEHLGDIPANEQA